MKSHLLTFSVLAALAASISSCHKDAGAGKDRPKAPPSIAAWVARDTVVERSVQGVGTVLPEARVDLRSEIAGRIASIGFKDGADVRKGQLLVKIADADLAAVRDKAKAALAFQRQTLARRREQLAVQAVAQQDVDAAVQALASAEADLALAEAQLAKTEIRAPFSGKAGLSQVSVGQYLTQGQSVAQLAQLHPLRVEFQVPADAVSRVRTGMELRFRPWGAKEFLSAPVYAAEPAVDSVSRALRVRARWDGKAEGIVAGSAVEVKLSLARGPAILLPSQGLGADARGPSVVLLRGGKAVPCPVVVGRRTAEAVEIVQGIKAGDTVLCNGSVPVKPGAAIRPSRYL